MRPPHFVQVPQPCPVPTLMSRRHPRRKSGGGRFAYLPLNVLNEPAVTTLSHAAHRVLVLLTAQYNGYNNGALGLTVEQAKKQNVKSNNTLYRALASLEERGLIEQTYPASRVPPRPTMYALTWRAVDDTEYSGATRTPSRTFTNWKPPKPRPKQPRNRLRVVR